MPSGDDPEVVTHDFCLILNPSLVSFLQHLAEDGVGIDERRIPQNISSIDCEIKIQYIVIIYHEEPRLARIDYCFRSSRVCRAFRVCAL